MSVNSELGNLVRLGDYIEEVVLKLGENMDEGLNDVEEVSE